MFCLQLCNTEKWPSAVTKAVRMLHFILVFEFFIFKLQNASQCCSSFLMLYEFLGVLMCDCKQIGKFLYSIIMSEVKVGNVSARKPVQTEINDEADNTFVR